MTVSQSRDHLVRFGVLALSGVLFLVACDGAPSAGQAVTKTQQTPDQRLTQRAEARWTALADRDFNAAYAFESPAYRATVTPQQFQGRFGVAARWLGAKVDSVVIAESGDRADVKVSLRYETQTPLGGPYTAARLVSERWISTEGEWWHVDD
jgi:hypothetical protein